MSIEINGSIHRNAVLDKSEQKSCFDLIYVDMDIMKIIAFYA